MMTEPLRLTAAEMASLMQWLLGDQLPATGLLADLEVTEAQLQAARESLLTRRLLLRAPNPREVFIAPDALAVLQTLTRPARVGILQIVRPDQPTHESYFSWTPTLMLHNWVEPTGEHVITPLTDLAQTGDLAVRLSGVEGLTTLKPQAPAATITPVTILTDATCRAMFMVVTNLQAPAPNPQAISWVVKDEQVWLLTKQPNTDDGALQAVTAENVRQAVGQLMAGG